MLNELQKEYSPLTSALIKGALWGFWHAPLWLVSGYTGINLLKYSLFFMILMISASVIIAFFYKLNRTLLIPIVIHQMLNFFTYGITGELLQVVMITSVLYSIAAILLVIVNPKRILYTSKGELSCLPH